MEDIQTKMKQAPKDDTKLEENRPASTSTEAPAAANTDSSQGDIPLKSEKVLSGENSSRDAATHSLKESPTRKAFPAKPRPQSGERNDRVDQQGYNRRSDGPGGRFRRRRRVLDTRKVSIDYKKPEVLERFISKTGKILPRRITGASARVQRKIVREIKRARNINLLPYTRR